MPKNVAASIHRMKRVAASAHKCCTPVSNQRMPGNLHPSTRPRMCVIHRRSGAVSGVLVVTGMDGLWLLDRSDHHHW